RQAAAALLAKALREKQQGLLIAPQKMTVGEWLDTWLQEYKKPRVRPSTFDSYEMLIRRHLKPALGHIALTGLRPEHVQHYCNEKLQHGLDAQTIHLHHVTLSDALARAEKHHLVTRNVARLVEPPRRDAQGNAHACHWADDYAAPAHAQRASSLCRLCHGLHAGPAPGRDPRAALAGCRLARGRPVHSADIGAGEEPRDWAHASGLSGPQDGALPAGAPTSRGMSGRPAPAPGPPGGGTAGTRPSLCRSRLGLLSRRRQAYRPAHPEPLFQS